MSGMQRVLIVVALACAIGAVFVMKREKPQAETAPPAQAAASVANVKTGAPRETPTENALPRLVDLGADKCIPCKAMAPILEELSKEYASAFEVEFIDVWKNPKAAEEYGVRMIPTQIFYDADGQELFRHEGFFGKDDILAKWKEHGITTGTDSVE